MEGLTFASGCTQGCRTNGESATPFHGASSMRGRSSILARDEKSTCAGPFWTLAGNSARASCFDDPRPGEAPRWGRPDGGRHPAATGGVIASPLPVAFDVAHCRPARRQSQTSCVQKPPGGTQIPQLALQHSSPLSQRTAPHCSPPGLHSPVRRTLTPAPAATQALVYVRPSQPHTGE